MHHIVLKKILCYYDRDNTKLSSIDNENTEFTSPSLFTCLVSPFFAFLFHFSFSSLYSFLLSIFLLIKGHYMIQVKNHHHHHKLLQHHWVQSYGIIIIIISGGWRCQSMFLTSSLPFSQLPRSFILTIKLPVSEYKRKSYFLFPSPFSPILYTASVISVVSSLYLFYQQLFTAP